MEDEDQQELQLLPSPATVASSSRTRPRYWPDADTYDQSLDLQLSISLRPIQTRPDSTHPGDGGCAESVKWEAAEQIRLAAIEKAYAESVREVSRREMELAQAEFARARRLWQRAREEVEKAERLKARATRQIDSTCMEITCQSCSQKFRA